MPGFELVDLDYGMGFWPAPRSLPHVRPHSLADAGLSRDATPGFKSPRVSFKTLSQTLSERINCFRDFLLEENSCECSDSFTHLVTSAWLLGMCMDSIIEFSEDLVFRR
jgi:hypothetical protein